MNVFGVRYLADGMSSPYKAYFVEEVEAQAWADLHVLQQAKVFSVNVPASIFS
jgi:hypothetical protein